MSWLSSATGIHIGGGWGVSKKVNDVWGGPLAFASNFYKGVKDRYASMYQGNKAGVVSGVTEQQVSAETQSQEITARKAAHDAEVAQLAAGALGTVALRRKRGPAATMLTGSTMGGTPVSTGKTMLSQ